MLRNDETREQLIDWLELDYPDWKFSFDCPFEAAEYFEGINFDIEETEMKENDDE